MQFTFQHWKKCEIHPKVPSIAFFISMSFVMWVSKSRKYWIFFYWMFHLCSGLTEYARNLNLKWKIGLIFVWLTWSLKATLASTDCLFVCLQLQRVHIVFSQREFTHVTWSRVPEPLLSAILVVCMGFYKLYYISPSAGCVVSSDCAGALTDSIERV